MNFEVSFYFYYISFYLEYHLDQTYLLLMDFGAAGC